jgi:hypothetical protein
MNCSQGRALVVGFAAGQIEKVCWLSSIYTPGGLTACFIVANEPCALEEHQYRGGALGCIHEYVINH